ncbi:MAG: C69 family dipeptidase [Pseudomonadota bacterium]
MCTSVSVGKEATKEGVILISRNEDCLRANWNKYLVHRAEPEYVKYKNTVQHGLWVLGNGLKVPVPENAFSYSGTPDADSLSESSSAVGSYFYFEERGINEKNFAISATNSLIMNTAAEQADPLVQDEGVIEANIPTLLLSQATSAQHALELLGHYVETYGAGEANGVLLADPNESWYFEIGSGHHWIAVRIPADRYIAVANGMRVHDVDLSDTENVRHSNGLVEFVEDHKLLKTVDPAHFDFAAAFGDLTIAANYNRIWLAQHKLTPSLKQDTDQHQYPMFLKPDKKVGVDDVMGVLTATYEGTPLQGKATRTIGWDKTGESHIITLDPNMPAALAGIIWQSISTPLCAPYMPLYRAMTEVPQGFAIGSDQYSATSAYWAFRGLFSLAKSQGKDVLDETAAMWHDYVAGLLAEHAPIKKMIKTMYEADPQSAVDFVSRYSTGITFQAIAKANTARNALMTKIAQDDQTVIAIDV